MKRQIEVEQSVFVVRFGSKAALGVSTKAFHSALGSGPCEAKRGSQPRATSGLMHRTKTGRCSITSSAPGERGFIRASPLCGAPRSTASRLTSRPERRPPIL
jgi:hypothetical protein